MRVGMVVDNDYVNDARVSTEAKRLTRAGYQVIVLCLNYTRAPKESEVDGVYVYRVQGDAAFQAKGLSSMNSNKKYEKFWTETIQDFMKLYECDLLHVHNLYLAKAAKDGLEGFEVPVVLDLRSDFTLDVMDFDWATKFPKRLFTKAGKWTSKEKEYLAYADKLIVPSETYKDKLLKKYGNLSSENIYVFPNLADASLLSEQRTKAQLKKKNNEIVFTVIGEISKKNGSFTCLEALKQVIPSLPQVRMVFVGAVAPKAQKAFDKAKAEVKTNFTHIPKANSSEIISYIEASDVCIYAGEKLAQNEVGVANEIYKYVLFAKPVITSNCAPAEQFIGETGAGYVFQAGNAADLAENMLALGKNDVLRLTIGLNGRQSTAEYFNQEVLGLEIIQAYFDLLPELHAGGEEEETPEEEVAE